MQNASTKTSQNNAEKHGIKTKNNAEKHAKTSELHNSTDL